MPDSDVSSTIPPVVVINELELAITAAQARIAAVYQNGCTTLVDAIPHEFFFADHRNEMALVGKKKSKHNC